MFSKILPYFLGLVVLLCVGCKTSNSQQTKQELYSCMPCGLDCDKHTYTQAGKCPHCEMDLVKVSSITFKTIQPDEICAYMDKNPAVVLLDVRTEKEFAGKAEPNFGTLQNAINIPIQDLESKLSSIEHLKEKEIIVFCSHSHRSPRASYLLTQHGFKRVMNMAGGMSVMSDKSCVK